MTESTASSVPSTPSESFWEDLIDVFYQPAAVFRRREKASAWAPFLFVVAAMAIITYATFPAIQPAIDGDVGRMVPQMLKQYPQLNADQLRSAMEKQSTYARYFGALLFAAIVLFDGFLVWLVGKMFGAVESL